MLSLTRPLILASNSPRRKQLLNDAGFNFTIEVLPTDETFPDNTMPEDVAGYISEQKAEMFRNKRIGKLVLTADTVVVLDHHILGKPENASDAYSMLRLLSGKTHKVITAVSLLTDDTITTLSDMALVTFDELEETEIKYYIEHYKPFDKAGSYGIQEWIGMIGIKKIEGSFYTIMGLPVQKVYQLLKPFVSQEG